MAAMSHNRNRALSEVRRGCATADPHVGQSTFDRWRGRPIRSLVTEGTANAKAENRPALAEISS